MGCRLHDLVRAGVATSLILLGGCGGGKNGSGNSTVADTGTFAVGTTATRYTVSGTVSGLSGSGLVLLNNGSDDLAISISGGFSFTVSDGSSYAITVKTQPTSPTQQCTVTGGTGTVSGGDVGGIAVDCVSQLYKVVDTGQTRCYDSNTGATRTCSGTGQDGAYTGNTASYTLSDDGTTVLDNVTGLRWTQSTDITGDGLVNYSDKLYQADAVSYCANLTLGGYTWRLPDIKEAYSLILFTGSDPSGYTGTDTSVLTPFIDPTFDWAFGDQGAGDRIIDAQYASSTLYVSTTMTGNATMFGVNYVDGRIKGYPKAIKKFYVRCVTGNSDYGANDFVDNGDQTISDRATGLMWQQDDGTSTDWDNAITMCESATTGGYSDWRPPNAKELQSIVDYTRSPDTSGSAAIDPLFNATSITNENNVLDWGYYWASTTHATYSATNANNVGMAGVYLAFGRAVGYMSPNYLDVHGAGAQRSNYKLDVTTQAGASSTNLGYGTFWYHGPQGDILRHDNKVRCVRDY